MAGAATDTEATIRVSVRVEAPIEHAFRVFTEDMSAWWPASHHIGDAPMVAAIVEPRVGGRWYEMGDDGSDCQWGIVLAWDPPRHVALSWHLDGDFRYDGSRDRASRVDVRFREEPDGSTSVELVHSEIYRHGPTWQRLRSRATGGWSYIVDRYRRRAAGEAVPSETGPVS
jgi:uncharacterized protein YndB with AHSA1/START domain